MISFVGALKAWALPLFLHFYLKNANDCDILYINKTHGKNRRLSNEGSVKKSYHAL